MNIHQYAKHVPVTLAPLESPEADWFHMQLGLGSEYGEMLRPIKRFVVYRKPLDFVGVVDEAADICWYAMNMWLMAGLDLDALADFIDFESAPEAPQEHTMQQVLQGLSATMGYLANQNPEDLPHDLNENALVALFAGLQWVCWELGRKTLAQAFDMNIVKLRMKRYKAGFTEDEAVFRDLVSERALLEAVYNGEFDLSVIQQ